MILASRKSGSALLVAILVMGILMTLTLGLSNLVTKEIRQTTDVVAATQAYFASEAGIENGLLDHREHLPGYEVGCTGNPETEWKDQKVDEHLHYRYRVCDQGNKYPYFEKDKPVFITQNVGITRQALYDDHAEHTYNILPLNGTVTIPLFVENEDGSIKNVHKFLIQYYVNFDIDPEIDLLDMNSKLKLENFNILRWKVYGEPLTPPNTGKTEVISDFFPAYQGNSAQTPVCIGSSTEFDEWQNCKVPIIKFVQEKENYAEVGDDSSFEDVANSLANVWSIARECYLKDAGEVVASTEIQKGCSIEGFVKNHTKNFITLVNVVNPGIIGMSDPAKRAQKANIYYRIIAQNDEESADSTNEKVMVREYTSISADGYASSDRVKQSLDVQFKLNNFLSVFNFSLFRTDTTKVDIDE